MRNDEDDTRVGGQPDSGVALPQRGSELVSATFPPVSYDEIVERTVAIMRDLNDLKDDVLFSPGLQPQFDGGMLEAALTILRANVDDDDPRVRAEMDRAINSRLNRALARTKL